MTKRAQAVLKELESRGTDQNRKVYSRHGVTGPMYGVSYANLKRIAKGLRGETDLARELWASGNHDARILATMIAEGSEIGTSELDAWSRDLDNYVVTDSFSSLAARSGRARRKYEIWSRRQGEYVGQAGWNLLASVAMQDGEIPDDWFEEQLRIIEEEIHERKNRVRHSMNMALIAIGVRNRRLERQATAAAKRIGKVKVDHGETGCKTPEAVAYIRKTLEHRRLKVARQG